MLQVFETVQRIAETDANVLLLGENGTGKDLVAQAIHAHSRRCIAGSVAPLVGRGSKTT